MTVRVIDTTRLKVRADPLYSDDFLDPYSTADQTAGAQAFLDALCQAPTGGTVRSGQIVPARYRVSDALVLDNSNTGRPIVLHGIGGEFGAAQAATHFFFTSDPGAGKYAIDVTTQGGAPVELSGIGIVGSQDGAIKGRPQWACKGFHINGRMHAWGLSAVGFGSGVSIDGDHHHIHDCVFQANSINIDVPPGGTSQGDVRIAKVQAGGSTLAALGVAKSSQIAGWRLEDVELSTSPFCIMRYDDGGAVTVTSWITGLIASNIATEFTGNGIVYDDVQDGASITQVEWNSGIVNWGLYATDQDWDYLGVTKPKVAAWFNGGPISDVLFTGAFPTSTGGLPGMQATAFSDVRCARSGRGAAAALAAGSRYFELTAATNPIASFVGYRAGEAACLIQPYRVTGTGVVRGELLTNLNELGATKYAGPVASKARRVVGVAAHDATTGQVVHAIVAGNDSDTKVLNSSGSTVANGDLLIPHPSGGVQTAGATYAGQVIGRMLASTADGTLGQAEIFI
jgi:hypothetical protein